jgi:hypothetical protein
MPLLHALGAEIKDWPGFTAALVLELWELHDPFFKTEESHPGMNSQLAVRVLYEGAPLPLMHSWTISPSEQKASSLSSLEGWLPLSEMVSLLGNLAASDDRHKELCFVEKSISRF